MNTLHKIITTHEETCNATLYNGKIVRAGPSGNFKTALFFNNEPSTGDKPKSFAEFNCDSFINSEISFSIWVAPKKESFENAGIISNESNGRLTGLFLNSAGEPGRLGVMWDEDKLSTPLNSDVYIESDRWTHLVVIFSSTGLIRIFKNGVFNGYINVGIKLENVEFSNIKLGGFCGWVDDLNIYPTTLKYGNVPLGQTASENVAYLFNTNRITGSLGIPVDLNKEDGKSPFQYIQSTDYVTAYENYKLQKLYNHTHYEDMSKYVIDGGENQGTLAVASGSFRTFLGKITSDLV